MTESDSCLCKYNALIMRLSIRCYKIDNILKYCMSCLIRNDLWTSVENFSHRLNEVDMVNFVTKEAVEAFTDHFKNIRETNKKYAHIFFNPPADKLLRSCSIRHYLQNLLTIFYANVFFSEGTY